MKILLSILFSLLLTSQAYAGTNYYVKNCTDINGDAIGGCTPGSDSNDGLTDGNAFLTIAKCSSTAVTGSADICNINRGDVFREVISGKAGTSGNQTIYQDYGSGAKPLILGSALNYSSTGSWTDLGSNIWSAASSIDVGNLIFNSEASTGTKVATEVELTTQGYFWWDDPNNVVKVYSVGNPGTFYTHIEVARNANNIGSGSYVTFKNLDVRYAGAHGIDFNSKTSVNGYGVDFSFIGGSYLTGTVRYGNAIQVYNSNSDCIWEAGTISQVYDAGFTVQGTSSSMVVSNIIFRNYRVDKCEYSVEFWGSSSSATIDNVHHDNNTLTNAGGGWGHNQRPDGASGHHLMVFPNAATTTNSTFNNNIMDTATEANIRILLDADLLDLTRNYNLYYNSGGHIGTRGTVGQVNYDTIAALRTGMGGDANSIQSDPDVQSDYTILSTSPAKDAGTTVTSVNDDFYGTRRPQGTAYDIGSFEVPVPGRNFVIGGHFQCSSARIQ